MTDNERLLREMAMLNSFQGKRPTHRELRAALERMVRAFQPLRSGPIGAPHSPVRLEQEEQIAAHDQARAVLRETE